MKIFAILFALTAAPAFASTTYQQPLTCSTDATAISLNAGGKSATLTCADAPPVTPPTTATVCKTGEGGDVPGYTAICSGRMALHNSGGKDELFFFPYSFANVFGGNWPGTHFGYTEIFTIGKTQFLSIPFVGNPAHAIGWVENQTNTPQPITFSVSTAPGLFNGGVKGTNARGTIVCVATRNPNFTIASRPYASAQCQINTGTTYWLNVILGNYNLSTGAFVPSCDFASCSVGFNENDLN